MKAIKDPAMYFLRRAFIILMVIGVSAEYFTDQPQPFAAFMIIVFGGMIGCCFGLVQLYVLSYYDRCVVWTGLSENNIKEIIFTAKRSYSLLHGDNIKTIINNLGVIETMERDIKPLKLTQDLIDYRNKHVIANHAMIRLYD